MPAKEIINTRQYFVIGLIVTYRGAQTGEKCGAVAAKWVRGRATPYRARTWMRPSSRAWAPQSACTSATPGLGAAGGPPGSVHDRDPRTGHGRGTAGHDQVRRPCTRPQPGARAWARLPESMSAAPRRVPVQAGQHARACRSAPPKREGRRIMGHVTSPEKMHRGAIDPYQIIIAWIGIPVHLHSSSPLILKLAVPVRDRPSKTAAPGTGPGHAAQHS